MKKTFIVAILNCWGSGQTLSEAARDCYKKSGGKGSRVNFAIAWLVLGDDKAFINDSDQIKFSDTDELKRLETRFTGIEFDSKKEIIIIGKFFRLGQLMDLTK